MEGFEKWCWRRMDISRTDLVRNKEALQRVKDRNTILQTIKIRKAK
jgi:hypothetical protein